MDEDRIHVALSSDGTRIAGRVHGQGAPLVLVHGGLGNGEVAWLFMLPFLVEHFTCYLMSTRGRGLSGDNADHARERQFEDVAAFVQSIGEPVGLFGHSSGALWALGGAALCPIHVRALALYEPPFPALEPPTSDEQYVRLNAAITEDRRADAVQVLTREIIGLSADEQALFSMPGVAERAQAAFRWPSRSSRRRTDRSRADYSTSSRCLCSFSTGRTHAPSSRIQRMTSPSGSPMLASLRSPARAISAR